MEQPENYKNEYDREEDYKEVLIGGVWLLVNSNLEQC